MKPTYLVKKLMLVVLLVLSTACTTTTIDEYRQEGVDLVAGRSVVVLGRRHTSGAVTEPFVTSCISSQLGRGKNPISVIGEQDFQDRLYPWFEPRTAPLQLSRLKTVLAKPIIANEIKNMGLQYIVWVDGSTQRGASAGGMSCSIGVGGAGCLGFGTWEDDGEYELSVWDISQDKPVAEMSASAAGVSYMPAVVVPLPLIARVKTSVCNGLAQQIKQLFPE
ncbi:MAG: hypothetical protein AB8B86_13095 [Pseudomonadales bacterium]